MVVVMVVDEGVVAAEGVVVVEGVVTFVRVVMAVWWWFIAGG